MQNKFVKASFEHNRITASSLSPTLEIKTSAATRIKSNSIKTSTITTAVNMIKECTFELSYRLLKFHLVASSKRNGNKTRPETENIAPTNCIKIANTALTT